MRRPGLFYPMLLLFCWTVLVTIGTFALLETTWRQHLALSYPVVRGKIMRSQVGEGSINHRGIDIEYEYIVNHIKYTGRRYRYDDHNATFEWASKVEGLPRWSSHLVHYNPSNPADALLEPGADGTDLLLLLFSLPMNVVTAIVWRAMFIHLRERSCTLKAGGVPIRKRNGEIRVDLAETSPTEAAFLTMAGVAFVAAFPIVIIGGFEPSMELARKVWVIVLAAGAGMFIWRALRNISGIYDLRFNSVARAVTLPQTAGRRRPLRLDWNRIGGVLLQRRQWKTPSGTQFSFFPTVKYNGEGRRPESIRLISWGWSEEKARAFGLWLAGELDVEFKGVDDESSAVPVEAAKAAAVS